MCPPYGIYNKQGAFSLLFRVGALAMAATAEVIAAELPGEGFAWNRRLVIRLGGDCDLEWSTIVGGEVKLRTAKACLFCGNK
jgi:hypothetical protein